MDGRLTTLDQLETVPNWNEIHDALIDQGLIIDENDVFVMPDMDRALEDAQVKIESGELTEVNPLYPIFDLNLVTVDTLPFQNRMDQILGYDTEADNGIVGVNYADLKRLVNGYAQKYETSNFRTLVEDTLGDLADAFIDYMEPDLEGEVEGSEGESEEGEGYTSSEGSSSSSEDEGDILARVRAQIGGFDLDSESEGDEEIVALPAPIMPLPPFTPVTLPAPVKGLQPPPMNLPLQSDLGTLNQVRMGLAQIQPINPQAGFQKQTLAQTGPQITTIPLAPLPSPGKFTLPSPLPIMPTIPAPTPMALPQVTIPTLGRPQAPITGFTVEIPRFTTKMEKVALPTTLPPAMPTVATPTMGTGVTVTMPVAATATTLTGSQQALEIAKQIQPEKINAGRVSKDDKRFYTTDELKEFARLMGLRVSGSKAEVIDRIKEKMRQAGMNI